MRPTDQNSKNVEQFFSEFPVWSKLRDFTTFTFVAVRTGSQLTLIAGAVEFHPGVVPPSIPRFETKHVIAMRLTLAEMGLTAKQLVSRLRAGKVRTPTFDLTFPPNHDGVHSAQYNRMRHITFGVDSEQVSTSLLLTGGQATSHTRYPDTHEELRTAPTPYKDLRELLATYGVNSWNDTLAVKLTAFPIAWLAPESSIAGTVAHIQILLPSPISSSKVRLGFLISLDGRVVERDSREGKNIKWVDRGGFKIGAVSLDVPRAASVRFILSYDDREQQEATFEDTVSVHNERRQLYEPFDADLTVLSEVVDTAVKKYAFDFEAVVSFLIWMLGFSPCFLGGTTRIKDAPDVLAETPSGNIIVVECTTGLLKAENKLAQLHERVSIVRHRVTANAHRERKVLGLIVTSKPREHVRAEIESAEALGILVVCKEELNHWIAWTRAAPDPETLYADWENTAIQRRSATTSSEAFGFQNSLLSSLDRGTMF